MGTGESAGSFGSGAGLTTDPLSTDPLSTDPLADPFAASPATSSLDAPELAESRV
jgi:hypothetical protein